MKKLVCWFGLAFGFLSAPVHAQTTGITSSQEISTYPVLPCAENCADYVPAKQLNNQDFGFRKPHREGIVTVSFTIGTDGRVKNPVIERTIGAQDGPDLILDALDNYFRFKPALEDGKPVEENVQLHFFFNWSLQARHGIAAMYHDAIKTNSDPKKQIAALRAIYSQPDLNLYEIAMISAALAQIEVTTGDYDEALDDITIATLGGGRLLDKDKREPMLRLDIGLKAHAGQDAEAFATFETLKKSVGNQIPDDDPTAQLIAHLHSEVDSAKPLWTEGKVPSDQSFWGQTWTHTMLRRSFGFAKIQGTLTKFHLRCQTHSIESPITESATWTIPPSWAKCNILVEGNPGTTFQFGEAQPGTVDAPAGK